MGKTWRIKLGRCNAAVLAGLTLAGCQAPLHQTDSVELLILPASFVVDGQMFATANDAVNAALAKQPTSILLPACGAMETRRVIYVMDQLKSRFGGRLSMSVLPAGARGCPAHSS